jgi:UDP-N-acetylglucosamine 4,6-dehydratase (inverting)
MKNFYHSKTVLITGGTGSFGSNFLFYLLKKFKLKKIIIFSRDEYKQYQLAKLINKKDLNRVRFFIGDVRDKQRLKIAIQDVNYVVHAAALKQVPSIEYNPIEAIKTNVIGAQNIIEVCATSDVQRVIALSSDKAAAPVNLYGATKLLSDKLFISANYMFGKNKTKFSVVRYGNVIGSRGSVVPLFLKQANLPKFTITDDKMTRFNITLDDGVIFVSRCLERMWGGEIFVPKLHSYRILDVVKSIKANFKYIKTGIRVGEKLHEEMITKDDSRNAYEYNDHYIIFPNEKFVAWKMKKYLEKYPGKKCRENFSYNSLENKKYLTVLDLKKMINSLKHIY